MISDISSSAGSWKVLYDTVSLEKAENRRSRRLGNLDDLRAIMDDDAENHMPSCELESVSQLLRKYLYTLLSFYIRENTGKFLPPQFIAFFANVCSIFMYSLKWPS